MILFLGFYLIFKQGDSLLELYRNYGFLKTSLLGSIGLYLSSLLLMFLRRERFFYWWTSFICTVLLTPIMLNVFNSKLYNFPQKYFSESYQCPRGVAKSSAINFGEGYDNSKSITTKSSKKENDVKIGKDEEITRPCVHRYKGEPAFSYLKRISYILYLEAKKENYRVSRKDLDAFIYRLKNFKSWSYEAPIEDTEQKILVYYSDEHLVSNFKTVVNDLLLSTEIYKSNLSSKNIEYVRTGKGCKSSKSEMYSYINKLSDKKMSICTKMHQKKITHLCYRLIKGSLTKKEIKKNNLSPCLEQKEDSFAITQANSFSSAITCNKHSFKMNVKAICVDKDSPFVSLTKLQSMKMLANALFGYNEVTTVGEEKKMSSSGTILDQYNELFDTSSLNKFYHVKLYNLLKTTRTLQFRKLRRIDE